jgi:hypothetical protein
MDISKWEKTTIKLTIFWQTGKGIQVYLMFEHSGAVDCDTDHYLMVQKLGKD